MMCGQYTIRNYPSHKISVYFIRWFFDMQSQQCAQRMKNDPSLSRSSVLRAKQESGCSTDLHLDGSSWDAFGLGKRGGDPEVPDEFWKVNLDWRARPINWKDSAGLQACLGPGDKDGVGCDAEGPLLHCWWECKLENSLFPTMESSTEYPQKIKNRTTVWFCHLMLGYVSKGNEIRILKTCLHSQVDCSIKTKHGQSFGLWEKARVGWFERIALKYVYYHMWSRSPVQVWCMRQGTQGWCTGMTQRDGLEGGSGWGTHVHPWLIHVNVWQKH